MLNARSVLVSALTGREIEEIDNPAHDVALEVGDVVLLASDGLNTLSDTEIALTIDQGYEMGAQAICSTLVQKVIDRGLPRQDNVTVVAARVLGYGARSAANADEPSLPLTQATTRTDIPTAPVEQAAVKQDDPMVAQAAGGEPASAPRMEPPAKPARDPVSEPVTASMVPHTPGVVATDASAPASRPVPGQPPAAPEAGKPKPVAGSIPNRRRLILKILVVAAAAAAIASVIVTQTL